MVDKTLAAARILTGLLLVSCILAPMARAGEIIALYGDENVGTSGAIFLRLPVGARAVAMGQAYTAGATDGSAPFWNPAGMQSTIGRRSIMVSHTEYAADIDLEYAACHWRRQNFAFGLFGGSLRSGDIPRTTELHQEGTGQFFSANQYLFGLAVTRSMTDRLAIGGTLKYFQENLDEFTVRSALMDLGVLYYIGIGDLRLGFSVRNFGPDMKPDGTPPEIGGDYTSPSDFQSYSAPTSGSFGMAFTLPVSSRIGLLSSVDFHHPSDYSESFRLGEELALDDMFFLRAGYETNRLEGGLAAGFGVAVERDGFRVRLDYAMRDMGSFGMIHNISVDLVPLTDRGRKR